VSAKPRTSSLSLFFPCYFSDTVATSTVALAILLRATTRRAPERRTSLHPIIRLRVQALPRARVLVEKYPGTTLQARCSLLLEMPELGADRHLDPTVVLTYIKSP